MPHQMLNKSKKQSFPERQKILKGPSKFGCFFAIYPLSLHEGPLYPLVTKKVSLLKRHGNDLMKTGPL
jgi:hypothetical protein